MFAFILAGHLKMTVETLMESMTWWEFCHWKVVYAREPFGALADDHRAVLYSGIKINSAKKPGQPFTNALHLLWWRNPDAFKPTTPAAPIKGRKGALLAAMKRILGKGTG